MFERFTDQARRVVILAQQEAVRLSHDYIGTEHLVLGILHEDGGGVAQTALNQCGVTLDSACAEVEVMVGRGGVAPSGHVPFTARAKKVLELSLREALERDDGHIGAEHILLGVIREGEGVGLLVLGELGVDARELRQVIIEAMRA